ncbi:MAG: ligD 1 [Anaerosporomusa subterranea]|jgi:bifunctional non-homologous end joining protein LigD|nr:ligD 1 [Anaerosporomusa subterranea]
MTVELLPRYTPMLAKSSSKLPKKIDEYAFEVKWDGIRALSYITNGNIQIVSRNGFDITFRYPEIHALGQKLKKQSVILDGELTAFDEAGQPSFALLQHRMNLEKSALIKKTADVIPVTYIIFDLLQLNDQSLINHSYQSRRFELDTLELAGRAWSTPSYHTERAADFLEASRKLGLEGIILKRLNSLYLPGKRSDDWLKVKNFHRQEFIIGGWTPGEGNRTGTIGALLLGYHDVIPEAASARATPQKLLYAGSCGTGFTTKTLKQLQELLQPLSIPKHPFASDPKKAGASFVQPLVVAEISFAEWTPAHTLRHPSFLGLRTDKDASYVIREQ